MTDYRDRRNKGHLRCEACGCCNGCGDEHAPNWTGSYSSGVNGLGKITTDRNGTVRRCTPSAATTGS